MQNLFLKLRLRLLQLIRLSDTHAMLIWAGVVGASGALVTIAFRDGIEAVEQMLTGRKGSLVAAAISLPPLWRLLAPAAGGMIAGVILEAARRFPHGATSDYMEAIAIGDGRLPVRYSLLRSMSSLNTIASGGSIGREGSMVQLSALCASVLGRSLRFDTARLRLLVACGAAAGITSAYNTPLAGALFVAEIVFGAIVMENFAPIVVASVIANLVMRRFSSYHPAYQMPAFPDIAGVEVLLFVAVGIVAGFAAPLFLQLLDTAQRQFRRLPLPLPIRLALGGLLVGAVSVIEPRVWGNGYSVVNALLHQSWVWQTVLVVLAAKLVATAFTVGSGAVGGVFTPTLFVGAAIGWLLGAVAHALFPQVASLPYAYVIVGMGAFLAAATNAPLMAILMIFEMTLSYQVVLPLMLAVVIAYLIAGSLSKRTMYELTSKRNERERERLRLRGLHVRDLLRDADTVVGLNATIEDMMRVFSRYPVKYLYVIDGAQHYQGVVALQDLSAALTREPEATARRAADFVRRDRLQLLTPEMSLGEALQSFVQHQGERLPVIESIERPILLGAVYKTALLEAWVQMSG